MPTLTEQQLLTAQILMVDDGLPNVVLLTEILHNAGYTGVESTTDSRDVEGLYRSLTPDLILLNLNLPQMAGFQAIEELKSDPDLRRVPVVVLTTSERCGMR